MNKLNNNRCQPFENPAYGTLITHSNLIRNFNFYTAILKINNLYLDLGAKKITNTLPCDSTFNKQSFELASSPLYQYLFGRDRKVFFLRPSYLSFPGATLAHTPTPKGPGLAKNPVFYFSLGTAFPGICFCPRAKTSMGLGQYAHTPDPRGAGLAKRKTKKNKEKEKEERVTPLGPYFREGSMGGYRGCCFFNFGSFFGGAKNNKNNKINKINKIKAYMPLLTPPWGRYVGPYAPNPPTHPHLPLPIRGRLGACGAYGPMPLRGIFGPSWPSQRKIRGILYFRDLRDLRDFRDCRDFRGFRGGGKLCPYLLGRGKGAYFSRGRARGSGHTLALEEKAVPRKKQDKKLRAPLKRNYKIYFFFHDLRTNLQIFSKRFYFGNETRQTPISFFSFDYDYDKDCFKNFFISGALEKTKGPAQFIKHPPLPTVSPLPLPIRGRYGAYFRRNICNLKKLSCHAFIKNYEVAARLSSKSQFSVFSCYNSCFFSCNFTEGRKYPYSYLSHKNSLISNFFSRDGSFFGGAKNNKNHIKKLSLYLNAYCNKSINECIKLLNTFLIKLINNRKAKKILNYQLKKVSGANFYISKYLFNPSPNSKVCPARTQIPPALPPPYATPYGGGPGHKAIGFLGTTYGGGPGAGRGGNEGGASTPTPPIPRRGRGPESKGPGLKNLILIKKGKNKGKKKTIKNTPLHGLLGEKRAKWTLQSIAIQCKDKICLSFSNDHVYTYSLLYIYEIALIACSRLLENKNKNKNRFYYSNKYLIKNLIKKSRNLPYSMTLIYINMHYRFWTFFSLSIAGEAILFAFIRFTINPKNYVVHPLKNLLFPCLTSFAQARITRSPLRGLRACANPLFLPLLFFICAPLLKLKGLKLKGLKLGLGPSKVCLGPPTPSLLIIPTPLLIRRGWGYYRLNGEGVRGESKLHYDKRGVGIIENLNQLLWQLNKKRHNQNSLTNIFKKYWLRIDNYTTPSRDYAHTSPLVFFGEAPRSSLFLFLPAPPLLPPLPAPGPPTPPYATPYGGGPGHKAIGFLGTTYGGGTGGGTRGHTLYPGGAGEKDFWIRAPFNKTPLKYKNILFFKNTLKTIPLRGETYKALLTELSCLIKVKRNLNKICPLPLPIRGRLGAYGAYFIFRGGWQKQKRRLYLYKDKGINFCKLFVPLPPAGLGGVYNATIKNKNKGPFFLYTYYVYPTFSCLSFGPLEN